MHHQQQTNLLLNQNHHLNNHTAQNSNINMASFVARLMSLNAHEMQCLHSDSELMKHLMETQLLVENRLQNIQTASLFSTSPNNNNTNTNNHNNNNNTKLNTMLHQQHQQQAAASYYDYYQQFNLHLNQQHQMQQQQQQHHQHQQAQQHQQIQFMSLNQLALDLTKAAQNQPQLVYQHQQQHHSNQQNSPSFNYNHLTGSQSPNRCYSSSPMQHHQYPKQEQNQNSTTSSIALGPNDSQKHKHEQAQKGFNPKKVKLSEYNQQNHQEQIQNQNNPSAGLNHLDSCSNSSASSTNSPPSSKATTTTTTTTTTQQTQLNNQINNILNEHNVNKKMPSTLSTTSTTTAISACYLSQAELTRNCTSSIATKKYKGEFDEPNPSEVEERQRMLARSDNYHRKGTPLGECACILGSEFTDKSVQSVLSMIEEWRHLETEERIKYKWDVVDLPKDIPLSDIKKFEDLRKEASNGRADFGGASKRKPLGIRGTRQFLLILYCLWGHPGRDDVMQKEGYCPHCFAKIKKANEQSTLVRVVNHFNMKHRRGANPRLSPHRDTPTVVPLLNQQQRQQQQQQLANTRQKLQTTNMPTTTTSEPLSKDEGDDESDQNQRQQVALVLTSLGKPPTSNLKTTKDSQPPPPPPSSSN